MHYGEKDAFTCFLSFYIYSQKIMCAGKRYHPPLQRNELRFGKIDCFAVDCPNKKSWNQEVQGPSLSTVNPA